MEYVLLQYTHELTDAPSLVYSELDSTRRERRRVEFYPGGLCFAYGAERGGEEVLSPTPFPQDLRALNTEDAQARAISPKLFFEVWNQTAELPDGFLGMFF